MTAPFPVADKVEKSPWGAFCADRRCGGPLYLDRIQTGPRIGVRETWRHVTRHPACKAAR